MSRRLFRALLRVLPFDFRADYGREMERTFEEQRREASSAAARARVWAENIASLVAIGPREHVLQVRQDVVYAVRSMRRNPGYVFVAVLTLALGIGANTAVFSIVHAVLLAPLPYGEPDRLTSVMNRWDGQPRGGLSDAEYLDYAEHSRTLEIAAMAAATVTLTGAGEPERVEAAVATANIFSVLERQPLLGRAFGPAEAARGNTSVAISESLWRRRFGANPSIIGEALNVNGTARTVVAVLPADFVLPIDIQRAATSEVIVPAPMDAAAPRVSRGNHYLTGVGRLRSGATVDQASAEMAAIVGVLERQYPDVRNPAGFGVTIEPLRDVLLGDSRPVLFVLAGSVALVLLLACANVANLLLARGESRRRELAVRASLGASRFRVARQLVTESFVLALGATALGLLIASWSQAVVLTAGASALPRLAGVTLNAPVLLFAATLAVITTLVFGVWPALHMSSSTTGEDLKDGARGGTSGARAHLRRALVVCQVTLAVVLVVGAGLLLKSFSRVIGAPSGFDADHVLTARVSLPAVRYPGLVEVSTFYTRLLERVRSVPGVEAAGASTGLPLAFASGDWAFDIEGRPRVDGRKPGRADWYAVTPGYFETLRVPVVAGRGPQDADAQQAPLVIFVNETAARTLFPAGDAVGQRLRLSNSTGPEQPWRTIAGVIADVRQRDLHAPARPEMFIPYQQFVHHAANVQARTMTLVVRTAADPETLIPGLRGELRLMDPLIPLADARPMSQVVWASVADRRLSLLLVGAFAVLAMVLATVGVYGVVSYDALQRTREVGIRMALGASPAAVLSMMFRSGIRLVIAGALFGLVASAMLSSAVAKLLFEVSPTDVGVFAVVGALLTVVGAAATYLPARRATRVDPLTAFRAE